MRVVMKLKNEPDPVETIESFEGLFKPPAFFKDDFSFVKAILPRLSGGLVGMNLSRVINPYGLEFHCFFHS